MKRFLKKLWAERFGLLQGLAYILVVGWYGYSMRIIIQADKGIFLTALMVVGGLVLSVFTCVCLHNVFSVDDEREIMK